MHESDYESFDPLLGDYSLRSGEALNQMEMAKLALVSKKELSELTEDDLQAIGLKRQSDPDFERLYAIENLDHLKIYLTIEDGDYFLRGFQLRLIKQISTTQELIKETLLNWKLKLA